MIGIQENSRESIELQAVPRAEMEAAAANIRWNRLHLFRQC